MPSQFHNRLAGTIILVSLGVIILPDLFDGKKISFDETAQAIPLQPQIKKMVENKIQVPNIKDIKQSKEQEIKKTPIKTTIKESSQRVNTGWIIQVGMFRNRTNAEHLMHKLQKTGMVANIYPLEPKKDILNRVVVGPDLNRSHLSKQIKAVEKLTGLKVDLQKFDPLDI